MVSSLIVSIFSTNCKTGEDSGCEANLGTLTKLDIQVKKYLNI
jgi:hypothetical protein